MSRVRMTVTVVAAFLAVGLLVGCGSSGVGGLLGGGDDTAQYGQIPPPAKVETITVAVGKTAEAGPWKVKVRDFKWGTRFKDRVADDGKFLRVQTTITNSSEETVSVRTSDFVLANKDSYTPPVNALRGEFDTDVTFPPGTSGKVNMLFYVPPGIPQEDFTWAFDNSSRGRVRVEVKVKE